MASPTRSSDPVKAGHERGLPAEGYVIAGRSADVPAVVVAAQLGHASSAVTHAVYEHRLEDAALDVAVRSVRVAGSVAGPVPAVAVEGP